MSYVKKAYLFALLSVFFWSTVATAFKLTLRYTTPYNMLLWSSLFSTAFLLVLVVLTRKKVVLNLKVMLLGILNPALYYFLLFEAYKRLLAQEALCINYLWPVVLVIFSVIYRKERPTFKGILGVFFGFLGVVIVSTHGDIKIISSKKDLLGDFFALLSTFVWAFYWIENSRIETDSIVKLLGNFLFSLPIIVVMVIIKGGVMFSKEAILGSLYIGLFEMGLTFFLWLKALEYASKVQYIASLIYLAPPVSLLIIHLVLREPIYMSTILGFIFVLLGILISRAKLADNP